MQLSQANATQEQIGSSPLHQSFNGTMLPGEALLSEVGPREISTLDDDIGQYTQNPELFTARARLLSYLINLSKALDQPAWDLADSLLHLFGQQLADYLAIGHWQTYRLGESKRLADDGQLAAIASSTRLAMQFNDRFCRGSNSLTTVRPALETLALALDTRFELEDELFENNRMTEDLVREN